MLVSHSCNNLFVPLCKQIWAFLNSDNAHMFFASLATARAIFYYLRRSPLPEANELAVAILVIMVLAFFWALSETQIPDLIGEARECKKSWVKDAGVHAVPSPEFGRVSFSKEQHAKKRFDRPEKLGEGHQKGAW